ncbi:ArsC/Spx/MgsR family protein [Desulfobacter curvatus]|uniref:ArsC/Spx/MgsR family protein n=1 Tax=Desulfobacter curvatus TaxID=2290 RepID=UPI000362E31A|nr:ArsC/Spx/MgsR family protein [Desulfobacter curvatus]
MAQVTFYEKPGCINNTKQKRWLAAAGHVVTEKNILETQWTREELLLYFGDRPVADWFNRTAPLVKSGKVIPESVGKEEALDLMLKNPILIKRPLLRVGDERMQGFATEMVHAWIGLNPSKGNEAVVEQLRQENLGLCPMLAENTSCDEKKIS